MKLKDRLRQLIYRRYNISFSKSGDDLQLKKIINSNTPGTYLDIGCWDPVKASNSYYFYLRGWKGICIDPNPELINLYRKKRPKDTFVNCAIGLDKKQDLTYYMLNENYSSMNTLDYGFIEAHKLENEVKSTLKVPIYNLKEILEKYVTSKDRLDFFDVDVEGFDLEVLKTNDWSQYRPKAILVETHLAIYEDLNSETVKYLASVGYRLAAKTVMNGDLGNLFFIDKGNR